MSPYRYVKAAPFTHGSTKRPVVLSFVLMVCGSGILMWTMWPILSFSLLNGVRFGSIVSPIGDANNSSSRTIRTLSPIVSAFEIEGGEQFDSTNPNVWFPTSPQKKIVTPVNSYTISIPKLKIQNATVVIAGDDLKKSLIHYGGTATPGEYGTSVIFGHSTLPQFFSPTNYTSIFSTLPTLKLGDDIYVAYDGITYRYTIFEMVVTKPNDLSPLEQRFDNSYITLITCVPPGTYWGRLNVKARITKV